MQFGCVKWVYNLGIGVRIGRCDLVHKGLLVPVHQPLYEYPFLFTMMGDGCSLPVHFAKNFGLGRGDVTSREAVDN